MDKVIETPDAPPAIGPYSQGMRFGNLVFTSGQLPIDPETGEVSEDTKQQAHQCLKNLKAVLEAAGSGMDRVKKVTVFVRDMDEFSNINEVYKQYFKVPFPARSLVEVARLPKDVKVEIEALATVD
ncbi:MULTISPECIES: RidA family protein [Gammaproteobacteria]|uniref:RidA family protein n=1 Tax=Gammaproteobacteria TaxID=1236 RepID=UPI001AD9BCC8|nr:MULTISPECIES: RidA family protein [Gammaproteobacteria]MBO9483429.1 RidA family protein [Salinisphaera sp. G21_0]MBO9496407.1 RidA family protein [Thalassotalea sp. G20_0]